MGCSSSQSAASVPQVHIEGAVSPIQRTQCTKGELCTDGSTEHRVTFSHPGDVDYVAGASSSSSSPARARTGSDVSPPPSPGKFATRSDLEASPALGTKHQLRPPGAPDRVSCRYGRECKDKSEEHKRRFAHPGDADWVEGDTSKRPSSKPRSDTIDSGGMRKACKFGIHCFRKSDEHVAKFSHPGDRDYRFGLIGFEGVEPEFETLRQLFDFCDPKEHGNFADKDTLQHALSLLANSLPSKGSCADATAVWKQLGGELDGYVSFVKWAMWAQKLGASLPIGVELSPVDGGENHMSCGFVFAGGRRCDCQNFTLVKDSAAEAGSVQFCQCGHKRSMHAQRLRSTEAHASSLTPCPKYWSRHGASTAHQVPVGACCLARETHPIFQKLLDRTHKPRDNWTRDRGCSMHGLHCPKGDVLCAVKHKEPVPTGYNVVGVRHNVNQALWASYALNRGAVGKECETASGGYPFRQVKDVKTLDVQLEEAPQSQGCNEWFLFHGTKPGNVQKICESGFTLSLAGTGCTWKDEKVKKGMPLYGDGIYFAESITKADEYSAEIGAEDKFAGCYCVLVCRVLGGRVQWCDTDKIDPALLQKQVISGPFHSVFGDRVSKLGKPFREIVVYNAAQVYPEYVVYYRRLYS